MYLLGVPSDWKWANTPTLQGVVRLIEQLNCGLIVEDEKGAIRYVNQRILKWSGYSVEDLEGNPVEMLIPEELHSALESERTRTHQGDQRTRLSAFQRQDGRTFPVAVSPQAATTEKGERVVVALLVDLGEVQTARPMGAAEGSLVADLAGIAAKLQSMAFTASVAEVVSAPLGHPFLEELTEREREVLTHLMAGSRVPTIAEKLFISHNTVRNHLKAIYRKLDVSSQNELIERVRGLENPVDGGAGPLGQV
jgi:PAS domain S-box-containing protein